MEHFKESISMLITETSTNLPTDVRKAINRAKAEEDKGTRSALALSTISLNIDMAEEKVSPICQDTGMLTFLIKCPVNTNQLAMQESIHQAVQEATDGGILRPNSVDPLTGENYGNVGNGTPVIVFEQWENDWIDVRLMLKGGGCENKNIQYSLPADLEGVGKAGRNIDGIRKCIMHAVYQAQGHGCGAGFIGVGIGGDRTTSYDLAKRQLFRQLDDTNPVPILEELEQYVMDNADKLAIGTMGFGGEVTLLGCKIGAINRLPASFFVSVAYNCWAFRRLGVTVDASTGEIIEWLYEKGSIAEDQNVVSEAAQPSAIATPDSDIDQPREFVLQAPITEEQIRELRVGDIVIINGLIYTGRDALHSYLIDHDAPVDLNGAVLYHSGPVITKQDDVWRVLAIGPTTSIREEPYQAEIIEKFGVRAIIGKGGMGSRTLAAMQKHGAVYLNAIGGAAQYYANKVRHVKDVDFLNFGMPEAMWHLQVEGFAAVVTMDAHGNSLHADVEQSSLEKLAQFTETVFKD